MLLLNWHLRSSLANEFCSLFPLYLQHFQPDAGNGNWYAFRLPHANGCDAGVLECTLCFLVLLISSVHSSVRHWVRVCVFLTQVQVFVCGRERRGTERHSVCCPDGTRNWAPLWVLSGRDVILLTRKRWWLPAPGNCLNVLWEITSLQRLATVCF